MTIKRLFIVLFICAGLYALSVAKDSDNILKAELSSADNAPGAVTFTLTNTSTRFDVRLLIWNTPLEESLKQNMFDVQHNGALLPYLGRVVRRAAPTEADYTLLPIGESITRTVDLTGYYDFSGAGNYQITYRAYLSDIQLIDSSETTQANANNDISELRSNTLELVFATTDKTRSPERNTGT